MDKFHYQNTPISHFPTLNKKDPVLFIWNMDQYVWKSIGISPARGYQNTSETVWTWPDMNDLQLKRRVINF